MRYDEVGTHLKHPETINNNIKKFKDFLFLPLYIKNVMLSFREHPRSTSKNLRAYS